MKRFIPGLILGLAVGAAVVWWWPRHEPDGASAPVPAAPEAGETGLDVQLTPEQVAAVGLKVVAPQAIAVAPAANGFAHVVDPSPLLALDHERATAQAALTASQRELARLQALHDDDQNASARAVELARAEVARDEATLAGVRDRLRWSWGAAVSDALLERLRAGEVLLARVDIVAGEAIAAEPVELTLLDTRERRATVLGAAPQADPTLQGRAWLVTVRDTAGLAPGSVLTARVPRRAAVEPAWLVPAAAVVRHDGRTWVFVARNETSFERRAVVLGDRRPEGEVVREGLANGERIVGTGAQQLLSAGLSGTEAEE